MKAIVQKILNILKSFFFRVRVAIELHLGSKESHRDDDEPWEPLGEAVHPIYPHDEEVDKKGD